MKTLMVLVLLLQIATIAMVVFWHTWWLIGFIILNFNTMFQLWCMYKSKQWMDRNPL